jgi:hypothetical protein
VNFAVLAEPREFAQSRVLARVRGDDDGRRCVASGNEVERPGVDDDRRLPTEEARRASVSVTVRAAASVPEPTSHA